MYHDKNQAHFKHGHFSGDTSEAMTFHVSWENIYFKENTKHRVYIVHLMKYF